MTSKEFVKFVEKELENTGIKLELVPKKWVVVEGGVRVNGFFGEEEKLLSCAMDKPRQKWLPILLHEYCHFKQWQTQCRAWKRTYFNGEDISDAIFLWVKHKKRYKFADLKRYAAATRDVEADCEKRAHRLIKKFSLPLNAETYAQQANSYIYFYNHAVLRRKWWRRGHPPYEHKEVWGEFPTIFMKRYSQLPQKYIELYDKYC